MPDGLLFSYSDVTLLRHWLRARIMPASGLSPVESGKAGP